MNLFSCIARRAINIISVYLFQILLVEITGCQITVILPLIFLIHRRKIAIKLRIKENLYSRKINRINVLLDSILKGFLAFARGRELWLILYMFTVFRT